MGNQKKLLLKKQKITRELQKTKSERHANKSAPIGSLFEWSEFLHKNFRVVQVLYLFEIHIINIFTQTNQELFVFLQMHTPYRVKKEMWNSRTKFNMESTKEISRVRRWSLYTTTICIHWIWLLFHRSLQVRKWIWFDFGYSLRERVRKNLISYNYQSYEDVLGNKNS